MRVFVTGGTGLVGSAVVAELLANGHTVLALARSDTSARAIDAAGAEPLRGAIADLDTLRAGVARADGVIHLAFANDVGGPETLARAIAENGAALATLGQELVGSGRPLVTVSGTPVVAARPSTEDDPIGTDGPVGGRGRSVMATLGLAERGVRSVAVRMPRTVHNRGAGGFAGILTSGLDVRLPDPRGARPDCLAPGVRTGGPADRQRRGRRVLAGRCSPVPGDFRSEVSYIRMGRPRRSRLR